jgi:hypothetical protein
MIYIINGKRFNCVLDAMEYRDVLDANYIKVTWKQYERV